MEGVSKEVIIRRLERRYDYQSARFVMRNVLKESGLPDKPRYSSDEVIEVCAGLEQRGNGLAPVIDGLREVAKEISSPNGKKTTSSTKAEEPAEASSVEAEKTAKSTAKKPSGKTAKKSSTKAEKATKASAKKTSGKTVKKSSTKAEKATKASASKKAKKKSSK